VAVDEVTVPVQDGVEGDDQVELPQHRSGESKRQGGEERTVGRVDAGLGDLALEDGELVAQRQDLDGLVGGSGRRRRG
jgi:hypothetical protein